MGIGIICLKPPFFWVCVSAEWKIRVHCRIYSYTFSDMCLDLKIWAKYPIIRRIYLALEKFLSTVNGIHGDGWNELKNNGMLELLCSLKKTVGGII